MNSSDCLNCTLSAISSWRVFCFLTLSLTFKYWSAILTSGLTLRGVTCKVNDFLYGYLSLSKYLMESSLPPSSWMSLFAFLPYGLAWIVLNVCWFWAVESLYWLRLSWLLGDEGESSYPCLLPSFWLSLWNLACALNLCCLTGGFKKLSSSFSFALVLWAVMLFCFDLWVGGSNVAMSLDDF